MAEEDHALIDHPESQRFFAGFVDMVWAQIHHQVVDECDHPLTFDWEPGTGLTMQEEWMRGQLKTACRQVLAELDEAPSA